MIENIHLKKFLSPLFIFLFLATIVKSQNINWLSWEQSTFEKAKQEQKLIFLDVGTEWCTACNWMESDTYTNQEVIDILNTNFINIKVDAELQPNIGARYLEWGWPALIFMNPKGEQVLAVQGNRQPQNFIPILKQIISAFENNSLSAMDVASLVPQQKETDVNKTNNFVESQLNRYYDDEFGGWGYGLKMALYNHINYAFWTAARTANNKLKEEALFTLNQSLTMTDPVWGGIYFGSFERDWSEDMPEKRTEYQAGAMQNFALAYQITKDEKWLIEAENIHKYLNRFMRSEDGFYYNSQEEILENNQSNIEPEEYFALNNEQRLKLGVPPIDKTLHTDINARIIWAYCQLYEATNETKYLVIAEDLNNKLKAKARNSNALYEQLIGNLNDGERIREIKLNLKNEQYLKTQVWMMRAKKQLFLATNNPDYLTDLESLMDITIRNFYDYKKGAFFSSNQAGVIVNGEEIRNKSIMENGLALELLSYMFDITQKKSYYQLAKESAEALGDTNYIKNEGRLIAELALGLEKFLNGNIKYSFTKGTERGSYLLNAKEQSFRPDAIYLYDLKEEYPSSNTSELYVCSRNICSQGIAFNKDSSQEIAAFLMRIK